MQTLESSFGEKNDKSFFWLAPPPPCIIFGLAILYTASHSGPFYPDFSGDFVGRVPVYKKSDTKLVFLPFWVIKIAIWNVF